MKQHDANKIIEERLTAAYAGSIDILRANSPTRRVLPSGRFARFYIDPINTANAWLGAAKTRTSGLIVIELFVPLGEGDRTGLEQAGEFGVIFHNQDFSGVMCYAQKLSVVGAVTLEGDDVRRFKISCTVPFYFDGT